MPAWSSAGGDKPQLSYAERLRRAAVGSAGGREDHEGDENRASGSAASRGGPGTPTGTGRKSIPALRTSIASSLAASTAPSGQAQAQAPQPQIKEASASGITLDGSQRVPNTAPSSSSPSMSAAQLSSTLTQASGSLPSPQTASIAYAGGAAATLPTASTHANVSPPTSSPLTAPNGSPKPPLSAMPASGNAGISPRESTGPSASSLSAISVSMLGSVSVSTLTPPPKVAPVNVWQLRKQQAEEKEREKLNARQQAQRAPATSSASPSIPVSASQASQSPAPVQTEARKPVQQPASALERQEEMDKRGQAPAGATSSELGEQAAPVAVGNAQATGAIANTPGNTATPLHGTLGKGKGTNTTAGSDAARSVCGPAALGKGQTTRAALHDSAAGNAASKGSAARAAAASQQGTDVNTNSSGTASLKQGDAPTLLSGPNTYPISTFPSHRMATNASGWVQGGLRIAASHPVTPQSPSRSAASIASSAPISGSAASDKETRPTSIASSPAGSTLNLPMVPPHSHLPALLTYSPRSANGSYHPLPGPGDEPEDAWLRRIHMLNGGQNMPNLVNYESSLGLGTDVYRARRNTTGGSGTAGSAVTLRPEPGAGQDSGHGQGQGQDSGEESAASSSNAPSMVSTPGISNVSLAKSGSTSSPKTTWTKMNGSYAAQHLVPAASTSSSTTGTAAAAGIATIASTSTSAKGKSKVAKKKKTEEAAVLADSTSWPSVSDAAKEPQSTEALVEHRKSLSSQRGDAQEGNVSASSIQTTIDELQLQTSGQPTERKGKQYIPLVPTIIHNGPAPGKDREGGTGSKGGSQGTSESRKSSPTAVASRKKAVGDDRTNSIVSSEARSTRIRKNSAASHSLMKADAGRRQQQQQPSAQGATPSKRVASTKQESQPHAPSQPQPQTKVVTEKEDASTITAPNASVAEASTSSNSHCQTELGHSYAMPAPTAYVLRGQSHPRRGQSTRGRGSARGARGNSAGNVGPPYIPFAHASATAAAGATQPEGTYYPGGMPFAETEGSYRTGMPVSPYFYNAPPQQQNWAAYPQFGYDPYLYNNANFVPPESTFTSAPVGHMPDGPTYQLLAQIEFYFSQRNLQGDFFLRNCMDSDGWVPVSTVAAFNRIKRLGADLKTVVDTLLYSTVLDVDPERMMVRKMFGWEAWVLNAAGPNGLREQQRITRYPTDHQQQSRLHSQQVQYSSQHSNGAMSFPSVQTENKRAAQQQDSVTSVSGTVGNSASSSDPLKASTTASLISSAFRHSEDGKSSLGVTDDNEQGVDVIGAESLGGSVHGSQNRA